MWLCLEINPWSKIDRSSVYILDILVELLCYDYLKIILIGLCACLLFENVSVSLFFPSNF